MIKKFRHFLLSIGLLFLFPAFVSAQYKFEREYSVKSESIPQAALVFVDSITNNTKIKWFRENSQDGVSIEAKFKHNKHKYSVEFDTLGNLHDVEFIIEPHEVIPSVFNAIQNNLDSIYDKWKIDVIQMQYTGENNAILDAIHSKNTKEKVSLAYEIVLSGKREDVWKPYEITFDEIGNLIVIKTIIQANTDHLEY